nr:TonB-dependent receptor plug domain-containing protein [Deltaproteobacteria bacterium]
MSLLLGGWIAAGTFSVAHAAPRADADARAEPRDDTDTAVEPGEGKAPTAEPGDDGGPAALSGGGIDSPGESGDDAVSPTADTAPTTEPTADTDSSGAPSDDVPSTSPPPSGSPYDVPASPPPENPEPAPSRRSRYGDDTTEDGSDTRKIRVGSRRPDSTQPGRASTIITRDELEQRLPRSAPDALSGEPGVYVQKTAHGQGSPYLRGLTGQQTVMFFDGVRLNNSTFRQGPNQYFFTIDAKTIQRLEILRGSASTRFGSDALGGALLTTPIEPDLAVGPKPWTVHPRVMTRFTTADAEMGGRGQVALAYRGKLGILVGAGYRNVGQLKAGGRVIEPATGQTQKVPPLFEADDQTQRGTGFRELTSDARVVWRASAKHRVTLGYYDYRQFDIPRTDKCPPPTAPEDECLRYLQQFRTLTYAAFDAEDGPAAAETVRLTTNYQNQHERRRLDRGTPSTTEVHGEDDVH